MKFKFFLLILIFIILKLSILGDQLFFPIVFFTDKGLNYGFYYQKKISQEKGLLNLVLTKIDQNTMVANGIEDLFLSDDISLKLMSFYMEGEKSFYGFGNKTKLDDEIKIKGQFVELGFSLNKHFSDYSSLGIGLNYKSRQEKLNQYFPNESGTGLKLNFLFDNRDNKLMPKTGLVLNNSVFLYPASLSNTNQDILKIEIDNKLYYPIAKNILALRAFLGYATNHQSYLHLYSLGNPIELRGTSTDRYRGKNVFLLQSEYRLNFLDNLGLAFFVEAGQVKDVLDLADLNVNKGLGLYYHIAKDFFSVRLDIAFAKDEAQSYVMFNYAY